MKKIFSVIVLLWLSCYLYSQSYPVAVDDTVTARLGEYITFDVLENDYHPDGLAFFVDQDTPGSILTFNEDGTVSYYLNYEQYYNKTEANGYYRLIDINGEWRPESLGQLHIKIINEFIDTLCCNNVSALISSYGNHFWQGVDNWVEPYDTTIRFTYPAMSNTSLIFNSTFWIGGIDENNDLRLSAERYRQIGIDYFNGPLSFSNGELSIDSSTVFEWHRSWKLNKNEIIFHNNNWWKPDYEPIADIEDWPANGNESIGQSKYLAPFVDVDGDGLYDPFKGDYPLIKGDQCMFFVFNDLRLEKRESKGIPIGIEVHGMMYEFNQPDKLFLHNTVFMSYKVFNRSTHTLDSTYIGIWSDTDLGDLTDDYIGCDVSRGMYYSYNGDNIDGNGEPIAYGENPPAIGVLFLGGPTIEENGIDDTKGGCDISMNGAGFGDGIVDNERLGMTGFLYHNNGGIYAQSDPSVAVDYYNYLKMVWRDGTPLTYGETGYPNSGAYGPTCKFMFPDLSDTCNWGTNGVLPNGPANWSEFTSYNGEPTPPADRRGLGSTGPFTFKPGDVQKIDIAYVVARGDDGPLSSVELLKVYADSLRSVFSQNSDDFGTQYLGVSDEMDQKEMLKIYPNPANHFITFEYNYQLYINSEYFIYDMFGRALLHGDIDKPNITTINLENLEQGVYIVVLSSGRSKISAKFIKK